MVNATGMATCILEPRGAAGLEGYQAGESYRCEHRTVGANDGKPYYRVWPSADDTYYETCSEASFHKYFEVKHG